MSRVLSPILALLLASPFAFAKESAKMSAASKAVSKDLIDALATELERSMSMRVPGAPPPYFVSYKLTEVEVNDVSATLGAITASKDRHFVSLEAHVHVGNYEFDNTNFVVPQRERVDGIVTMQLPIEATPEIARKLAWLATDQAYKEALEQYTAKREALGNGATRPEAPSYTRVKPQIVEEPIAVRALEPLTELDRRATDVSRAFSSSGHVRDSRVAFTSFLERRWYLNSEGTSSHDTRRVSGVLIAASAQAHDGQGLAVYYTKYGHAIADLPGDDELKQQVSQLSANLAGLAKAPLVENYTGPILFEGEGAADFVRYTLHPHLSGTPPPVGVGAQEAQIFGGSLSKHIGRRVASSFFDISDDPTKRFIGKVPVIGGYLFDDEGVKAQPIDIVKKGMLVTLPTSRTPSAELKSSNGHARRSVAGGLFRGSPTNLVLRGRSGDSTKQLTRKLLDLVKKEGLPYGLVIRQFDDVAITSNADLSRIELLQLLRAVDPIAPPMATIAYKVLPTGERQLVRGVQLKRVDVNEWRSVAAIGRISTIKNFLASTENPLLMRVQGDQEGFVPSAGVESSISVPDLLVPELTVEKSTFGTRPPPSVPSPPR